jgi:hypothetical protein
MTTDSPGPAADAERIRSLIADFRNGEDPDLSRLSRALWELVYERIPSLTGSADKDEQHRILEAYLVELGLPAGPDLQYIAGPVLWFARERHVVPPARRDGPGSSSWVLDVRRFEENRARLEEGRIAFGDWMTNTLRSILAEQQ